MELNIHEFISEVFTRPVIWNQSNKSYHNRVVVEKNWDSIAAEIKKPKEKLKKKWKSLRDQFRNEMKKIPIAISGDPNIFKEQCKTYTTWPYFKSLLFLKDQMSSRHFAHINEKPQKIKEEISNNENIDVSFTDFSQDSKEATGTTNKKQKKNFNAAAEILAIKQRKLELLEMKLNSQKKERNDDEEFLNSLIPYMASMDMNRKMLCRMEMQTAVYKFAFPSPDNEAYETQYLSDDII